ncbi:MAG TPA: TetR/AcrR family transcriptional regulator [Desulfovibrio sp.]|jgi:AcrR family transcriptional regulator|uniref:TetR/AcrR family transcriptional regulator n=1 Tax=Desulfovibrio TaxID=872 RepID=UPI002CF00C55|nr:TetR/AcrR family transcriptional regulator [Desulfovibrio sp.]HMM38447.1 TetR/AcrR family transcriptional regulator [Desulfovibrio sp.]
MPHLKVIPINRADQTRRRLTQAMGTVLARVGFEAATVDLVIAEAGLKRGDFYRYFTRLSQLVAAYAHSGAFWPNAGDLIGRDREKLRRMSPDQLVAAFFKRTLRLLLDRPESLAIMAWEALSRNDLSRALEGVRERSALEFFELMEQDPPVDVDLTALVLFLAGGVNFLAVRSLVTGCVGGVDLVSPAGWARIEETIDLIVRRTLAHGPS